ncbi:hypothetical protein PVBG_05678 [Plasmodium vivax Brazil I]|uniref:VIR protein n=1 Tax=Plasmodium vivax (strain Brazil I) TaxID=1033975 RepID=A0A0J9T2B3_PLAV1|nr:hypothetical protein PVBG_05678 [Plasmodium vivax Brazil I]
MDNDFLNLDNYDIICKKQLTSNKELRMIPICKKYLRFLDNSKVWGDSDAEYDVSLLLNYWIYDKISSIYSITDIDEISIYFGSLQGIWDHFKDSRYRELYYHKFKPNEKILKEEDWEKRKELNEYYVNYDTLYKTARGYSEKCEEYYLKIKEMISVYKYFEEKCSSDEYKCPGVFHKCTEKNLESELKKLPCHQKMKGRTVSTSDDGSSRQLPGSAEGPTDPADGPALEAVTQLGSGDSGIREKVTNSVLGAAPVLLTATALYRYTPLGPWIRRFRGGRTNSMNAMDSFSPYTEETGNMFPEDTANYISYQPI